jgi:hypothetical protein
VFGAVPLKRDGFFIFHLHVQFRMKFIWRDGFFKCLS